jgi:hypothetical protein
MRLKPSTLLPLLAMGLIMGAGDPPSGDVVARRGDIVLTRPELAQSRRAWTRRSAPRWLEARRPWPISPANAC